MDVNSSDRQFSIKVKDKIKPLSKKNNDKQTQFQQHKAKNTSLNNIFILAMTQEEKISIT